MTSKEIFMKIQQEIVLCNIGRADFTSLYCADGVQCYEAIRTPEELAKERAVSHVQ